MYIGVFRNKGNFTFFPMGEGCLFLFEISLEPTYDHQDSLNANTHLFHRFGDVLLPQYIYSSQR